MDDSNQRWLEQLEGLTETARVGLDLDTTASELAARCCQLLAEIGLDATYEWVEQGRKLFVVSIPRGVYNGHGDTRRLAALACYKMAWRDARVIPSLPKPSDAELAMRSSGQSLHALREYMARTGVGLGLARRKLMI